MPELPEVETMRRGVLGIVGSTITAVERADCRLKPIAITPPLQHFRRRVVGRTIEAVDRIGKRVVLRLAGNECIVLEPRMAGLVLIGTPPNQEHLRVRIKLAGGPHRELLYWDRRGLGSVYLLSDAELAERFDEARFGPDALTLDAAMLRERLGASRREVKVALLDQTAVAGIGNLYASEILHLARVHPQQRCSELKPAEWIRIHIAMLEILEQAIRYEGSTLSDGTYRNALSEEGGYQKHHRVYDREGDRCPTCERGTIRRIVQAQRSTFFCPVCQRPRRVPAPQTGVQP